MFGSRSHERGVSVSIAVSARELRVLRSRPGPRLPRIEAFERRPLPLEEGAARRKALLAHLRELAPIIGAADPETEVRFVTDAPAVLLRSLPLPPMPPAEVISTVRLRWPQLSQTPYEAMRVDLFYTPGVNPRSRGGSVLVAGMPNAELDALLAPLREAGAAVDAVIPGAVALMMLRRAEHDGKGPAPGVEAILDIGFSRSCLLLLRGEEIHSAREITTAGHSFTQILGRELDLPVEQAEKLKREHGLLEAPDASGEAASMLRSIHGALRPVVERLAAEVERTIGFMQEERGEQRPERLLLTGGGACLPGLAAMMADLLGLPVEIWDPFQRAEPSTAEAPADGGETAGEGAASIGAMCLGCAAGRPPLNLLSPVGLAPRGRGFRAGPRVCVAAYLLVLALTVGWFWRQERVVRREVAAQAAEIAKIPPAELSAVSFGPYLRARAAESVDYKALFEELYWIVPEDVTLEAMRLERPSSPAGLAPRVPRVLQIEGVANGGGVASERLLAQLLESVEDSPMIRNVQLVRSARVKDPAADGLRFAFTFEVSGEAAAGGPSRAGAVPAAAGEEVR